MDKKTVKDFFDNLAKDWDSFEQPNSAVIEKILDYADIRSGCSVLDVACGTGILFPYYLKRNPLPAVCKNRNVMHPALTFAADG